LIEIGDEDDAIVSSIITFLSGESSLSDANESNEFLRSSLSLSNLLSSE
jgi:hypothetical protein